MECVILFRVHETDLVGAVRGEKGEIKVFDNRDAAVAACFEAEIADTDGEISYQVVELDEL